MSPCPSPEAAPGPFQDEATAAPSSSGAAAEAAFRGEGGADLVVRALEPGEAARRDAWVEAHPRGTVFHLAGWGRTVERVFGHQVRDLGAFRGDELVGVLPLAECRRLPVGRHLVSVPYGVYGGPLGADETVEAELIAAARRLARELRVGRLELRCEEPLAAVQGATEGLARSDLYVDFRQRLPADPAAVLARFRKDERRLVRRARDRHGLEVSEGPWFVGELARLFAESKQRLGSPGLPLAWFRGLQDELPGKTVLHVVRRGDELLAANLSFVHGRVLHMYYIGTTRDANREYYATSFLIAELMAWGVRRGCAVYDLGRSRADSGAAKFKRNQGFESRPLPYYYDLVRSRGLPALTPSNPRTKTLREAWRRLPAGVARRLSRRASRYLV